ncbi:MAG: hypothetical protein Q9216_000925 [Gyalolechia sp. 2 TL-2023]
MISLKYASFWILPLISAGTWLGMLLAMFIVWETQGSPHYVSMESNQSIAYISDIGAQGLQPLFIAGSCVTTISLDLSFAAERWLRHTGRLAKNMGMAEKILSGFSIIFAIAGTCGLILLSIFDTVSHPRLHDGFLLLFIGGYLLSAIFVCAEYQRLGMHFRQHRVLRASFWMKLFFIIVEVLLAAVFVGTSFTTHRSIAAVFEWIIAVIFTFYVLTFFVDLLPASQNHQKTTDLETGHVDRATMAHQNVYAVSGMEASAGAANGQQPKPPMAQNY